MPAFARVCEHCGEPVVEQRLLPIFAESLQPDRESVPDSVIFGDDPVPEAVPDPPDPLDDAFFDSFDPMSSFDDAHDEAVPLASEPTVDEEPAWTPVAAAAMSDPPAVETLPADEPVAPVDTSPSEASEPVQMPGVLFRAEEQEPPRRSRWREFAFATLVIGVGGALTFAAMRGNGDTQLNSNSLTSKDYAPAPPPNAAPAPTPPPAPAPAPSAAPVATASASGRWNPGNPAWSGASKRAVAFEVEANNMVSIWMRSVRPTLVVRCTAGNVEAFVYTSSAARIEPGTDDHTVRYSFDSGHETEQRWRDSEEHDALFAPDGESIARRLMDAGMFRFVFTPHNAEPASAHFSVAGLRPLIEGARNCRAK